MMRSLLLSFLLAFPFLMTAQSDEHTLEIPPRIFEYDAIELIEVQITEEDYLNRKAQNPGAMRHWTNVLKKHLYDETDFTDFWKHLEEVDHTIRAIDSQYFTFLQDTIFVSKYCDFVRMGKGDAFYDRIMIFKQDGAPVGLGKLSRHNNIGSFAPTDVFTDCFGQYNEMERMKALLD